MDTEVDAEFDRSRRRLRNNHEGGRGEGWFCMDGQANHRPGIRPRGGNHMGPTVEVLKEDTDTAEDTESDSSTNPEAPDYAENVYDPAETFDTFTDFWSTDEDGDDDEDVTSEDERKEQEYLRKIRNRYASPSPRKWWFVPHPDDPDAKPPVYDSETRASRSLFRRNRPLRLGLQRQDCDRKGKPKSNDRHCRH